MFRRKGEDNLFDATTETNQAGHVASEPSTAAATPASTATTAASVNATPASTAGNVATPQVSAASRPVAEPRAETRASAAPTANAFRPNTAPMGSDNMTRTRMPETKVPTPAAAGIGIDKSNKAGRRVLTVGNDILLKGEIATCDRLVIEGKVDATLNDVHTVEIAETGSFKGSANIEDAEISGLFEGDLVVRNRLVIYATGKVRGKISYGEIEIERGGELTGEIKTTNPQSATARPARSATAKEDGKVAA